MIPACPGPLEPRRPKHPPPPRACDTHCHVFGPSDRFPYAADRSYTPPDAPLANYLGMLDTLGFERGVLVQGSAHGRDNSAMLDALERTPDRLRGVAVADESISPAELRRWDALGVRALRFNHFFRGGQLHYRGGVRWRRRRSSLRHEGPRLASAVWIDCKDMPETIPVLRRDRSAGVDRSHGPHRRARRHRHAGLPGLLRYVGDGRGFVKVWARTG